MIEKDSKATKRTELHCHTSMTAMAGLYNAGEIIRKVNKWGSICGLAITDADSVQAYPDTWRYAEDDEIKVLYGVELSLMRPGSESLTSCMLIAKSEEGRTNLFHIITEAYSFGIEKHPATPINTIRKNGEGLIIGASCEGEVVSSVVRGCDDDEIIALMKEYDYIEVQPPANMILEDTGVSGENIIVRIIELADKAGKPVVAVSNAFFLYPDDQFYYEALTYSRDGGKADSRPLYLRDVDEMLSEFEFLGQERAREIVIDNPNRIASICDEISPLSEERHSVLVKDADRLIRTICEEAAHSRYGDLLPEIIKERMEDELEAIEKGDYASIYLTVKGMVDKSRELGYQVGARGTVGASLIAWLCDITDINPLEPHYVCGDCKHFEVAPDIVRNHWKIGYDLPDKNCPSCGRPMFKDGLNIPLETFLGLKKDKEPDFDINFGADIQEQIIEYLREEFGEGNVLRAGTITTISEKAAARMLNEYEKISQNKKQTVFIDGISEKITSTKKKDGLHPGGVMLFPGDVDVSSITPIQYARVHGKEVKATHFDFHAIDGNIIKYDVLGHNTPAMLHELEQRTGVNTGSIPLKDDKVMSLFRSGGELGYEIKKNRFWNSYGTLGIPEFSSILSWELLNYCEPNSFGDLIRILSLQHGTGTWEDNADDLLDKGIVLRDLISSRDDIMLYMLSRNIDRENAFKIMERVRKGKGLTEDMEWSMRDSGVPDWYIESCKKIWYLFPKAHSAIYAKQSWQMAYYKLYYPGDFYPVVVKYKTREEIPAEIINDPNVLDLLVIRFEEEEDLDWRSRDQLINMYLLQEAKGRGLDLKAVIDEFVMHHGGIKRTE